MAQWIEVRSPSDTLWLIDIQWMLSGYQCIWGKGCKGAHNSVAGDDSGCCGIGVMTTREDRKLVRKKKKLLKPEEWQEHGKYRVFSVRQRAIQTRLRKLPNGKKGKCIFYNDSDYQNPGCALHVAAINRGENYWDWKPNACVTVPFRIEWDDTMQGYVLRMIRKEVEWTGLDYWCGEDPDAYQHETPVFQSLEGELRNAIEDYDEGAWAHIYVACENIWKQLPKVEGQPVTIKLRSGRA